MSTHWVYSGYIEEVRHIELEVVGELENAMKRAGKTQADFAAFKGKSRQAVNPYFTGKKALLTDTALELFEFLGVRVRLEIIDEEKTI